MIQMNSQDAKARAVTMKSCLKLYGPRIADGLSALEGMMREIDQDISDCCYRTVVMIDPSIDLMTKQMISDGLETLGEYDFVIEWRVAPTSETLKKLIKKIDQVLAPTGCRYTITTE